MSTLHYYSGSASNSKLYTVREVYDFLHPYGELIHASFYKVLYMESECSINWCLSNRMNQKIICLRGINILTNDSNLGGVFSNKSSESAAHLFFGCDRCWVDKQMMQRYGYFGHT